MFKLFDNVTAVGSSRCIRLAKDFNIMDLYTEFDSLAATKITAVTMEVQGSINNLEDLTGLNSDPVIAIDSTAERFANATFNFKIAGTNYSKAADTAGNQFSAAHVVGNGADNVYGVIWLGINATGTFVSRVPSATQTYASAALAHAAADALAIRSDLCYVGRILLYTAGGTWTANTDDMTNASDITTATFISATPNFITLDTHIFNSDEITAQKGMWHVINKNMKWVRVYLSTLTGTGRVRCWLRPRVG